METEGDIELFTRTTRYVWTRESGLDRVDTGTTYFNCPFTIETLDRDLIIRHLFLNVKCELYVAQNHNV